MNACRLSESLYKLSYYTLLSSLYGNDPHFFSKEIEAQRI